MRSLCSGSARAPSPSARSGTSRTRSEKRNTYPHPVFGFLAGKHVTAFHYDNYGARITRCLLKGCRVQLTAWAEVRRVHQGLPHHTYHQQQHQCYWYYDQHYAVIVVVFDISVLIDMIRITSTVCCIIMFIIVIVVMLYCYFYIKACLTKNEAKRPSAGEAMSQTQY